MASRVNDIVTARAMVDSFEVRAWLSGIFADGIPFPVFAIIVLLQYLLPPVVPVCVGWFTPRIKSTLIDLYGFKDRMNGQKYLYQPIPAHAVRLLQVSRHFWLPWMRQFELVVVMDEDLSDNQYDAVSYTWDNQLPSSFVKVGGRYLGITQNVRDLLVELSSSTRRKLLWIDAICIDQSSTTEKNVQVRKMGTIYKQASRVPVWLAPAMHVQSANAPVECSMLNSIFESPETSWLGDLLSHRYWTRAWIVQEIALGQQIEIHYKGEVIQWEELGRKLVAERRYWSTRPQVTWQIPRTYVPTDDFCDFFTTADHFATGHADLSYGTKRRPDGEEIWMLVDRMIQPPAYIDVNTMIGLRQIRRIIEVKKAGLRSLRHLPSLILGCAGTRCSDPRDKIFAFLGLISQDEKTINPDYSVHVDKVFDAFARGIWDVRGGEDDLSYFDPLRLAGIGWTERQLQGQASWVTNWSELPDTVHDGFSAQMLQGYQAGGGTRKQIKGRINGDLAIMESSCRIDKITALSGVIDMDASISDERVHPSSRPWLREICDIVQMQILRLPELKRLGYSKERLSERDFRSVPGRWRGAIFRTLTAQSQSYWGWNPARHSKRADFFERPDQCDLEDLEEWYISWSNGTLHRRDFHEPDIDRELELAFEVWTRLHFLLELHRKGRISISEKKYKVLVSQAARFTLAARPHVQARRFALTRSGHMCLVPPYTRVGDEIWVNEFASVPYVYRRVRMYQAAPGVMRRLTFHFGLNPMSRMHRSFQVVGHCFALGLMNGERTILGQSAEDWRKWKKRGKIILI